jgi:release factor glutamine methyltransferase
MLPTPSTSHVSFDTVYEPAEDSFLLLDTLSSSSQKEWLTKHFPTSQPTPLVLEVGTGSGVVIGFLAANAEEIFGRDVFAMGIDVNEKACRATAVTVKKALAEQGSRSVYLGSVCADLFGANTAAAVDVLVFNPPYVPTVELPVIPVSEGTVGDQYQYNSHLLELSYAGGLDGMETTLRLLVALPHILSSRGVAYILLCAQNKPEEVKVTIPKLLKGDWMVDTVGISGKTAGWEKLVIIRIARQSQFVSSFSRCPSPANSPNHRSSHD